MSTLPRHAATARPLAALVAIAIAGLVVALPLSARAAEPTPTPAPGGSRPSPSPSVEVAPPIPRLSLDSDLRVPSNLSAWAIDAFLAANTPLPPLGAAFKAAEAAYHVNALYLLAHAMHESDFGRSYIAQSFHNLFGWNAVDRDPVGMATRFASFADSVGYVAWKVSTMYLDPAGVFYGGPTLRGMYRYATDPNWGAAIVSIANSIVLPTLQGRGLGFASTIATNVLTTGATTSVRIQATPASALPDGLHLAGRVRPVEGSAAPGQDEFVLTGVTSSNGAFDVPIAVGPTPGRYVLDFVLLDSDGGFLPPADAIQIPSVEMRVVPQYNVAFSALQGGGVIFRATNNSDGTLPALGPQLGSIVAGRPPTVLTAWLVRGGKDPAVLDRLAMPADLGSKAAWDAVIDLGETVLEPGDVLVVRLEVPDSSGAPQATEPGVFRVETATTGAGDGQGDGAGQGGDDGEARAGSGDDPIHLAQLDADDPLALAATALIPAPPEAQAMVAAGAGVTP